MTAVLSSLMFAALDVSGEQSRSGDPGPGLIAFLIVLALVIVCGLLAWSMLRHVRRVPPDLDVPTRPPREVGSGPDASADE